MQGCVPHLVSLQWGNAQTSGSQQYPDRLGRASCATACHESYVYAQVRLGEIIQTGSLLLLLREARHTQGYGRLMRLSSSDHPPKGAARFEASRLSARHAYSYITSGSTLYVEPSKHYEEVLRGHLPRPKCPVRQNPPWQNNRSAGALDGD